MLPRTEIAGLDVIDLRGRYQADLRIRGADALQYLIIHHSGSPWNEAEGEVEYLDRVQAYHQGIGWGGISYHFAVMPGGNIFYLADWSSVRFHTGNDEDRRAGVISRHNVHGLGILLPGRFMGAEPTAEQIDSTRELVAHLQKAFGQWFPVAGHSEFVATACPGDTWDVWRADVTVSRPPEPVDERQHYLGALWGWGNRLADLGEHQGQREVHEAVQWLAEREG